MLCTHPTRMATLASFDNIAARVWLTELQQSCGTVAAVLCDTSTADGHQTQLFITINDKEIISRMYNPYEVNVGDELTFQVDPSKVHFFDKETEKAII